MEQHPRVTNVLRHPLKPCWAIRLSKVHWKMKCETPCALRVLVGCLGAHSDRVNKSDLRYFLRISGRDCSTARCFES